MVVWGKTDDNYLLPSIKLTVSGAGWLTAAAVGSWMVDRELVASTIPGNIRQRNGLSIGAASADVRPTDRVSPWSKTAATRVQSNLPATLYAQASDGTTKALGSWVTDEIGGALSSESVSVDLLEASSAGHDLPQALPAYLNYPFTPEMPVDPVWTISRLLEQLGFAATPIPPMPDKVYFAAAMDGAIYASTSLYSVSGEIVGGWQLLTGGGLSGGSGSGITAVSLGGAWISQRLKTSRSVFFTLNAVGTVWLLDLAQGWQIRIVNDAATNTYTLAVSNTLGAPTSVVTFGGLASPTWPCRVQVEIERTWNPTTSQWTSVRARIRQAPSQPWSSWSQHTANHTPLGGDNLEMPQVVGGVAIPGSGTTSAPGRFGAVIAHSLMPGAGEPDLYQAPRAILEPLGGDAGLPFVPTGIDVWEAIQDAASASLAAVVVDLDGMARVLTRDDLAGVGAAPGTIDVGAEWEDLDWTLDPEDAADRLEVSFTPPSITEADLGSATLAPEAWSASEILTIDPGATVTIPATFDNLAAVGIFSNFIVPIGTPNATWSQNSNICAFDNPDGTGSPLASSSVTASAVQTSATAATITVENRTSAPAFLVDGNGDPCLILRARSVATYDTPRVVERGLPSTTAKRPLQVDLTPWVQSEAQATTITNFLWDRISGGGLWKASSVRCRLDWSLDIGQVRTLAHSRSGLDVRVLIAKVHFDGTDGQIAQSLDLVLIPWTYSDFAAKWPSKSYAQFATAQGARTYADHQADPLWTGA